MDDLVTFTEQSDKPSLNYKTGKHKDVRKNKWVAPLNAQYGEKPTWPETSLSINENRFNYSAPYAFVSTAQISSFPY